MIASYIRWFVTGQRSSGGERLRHDRAVSGVLRAYGRFRVLYGNGKRAAVGQFYARQGKFSASERFAQERAHGHRFRLRVRRPAFAQARQPRPAPRRSLRSYPL